MRISYKRCLMKERMARRLCGVPNHGAQVVTVMVSLAVGLCVVSGAPEAMEPAAAAPPSRRGDVGCFRPLSDVIWGFVVTLLACTVAVWGLLKHGASDITAKMQFVLFGVFAPIHGFHIHIAGSFQNVLLLCTYHKSIQHLPDRHSRHSQFGKLRSWLSPLSKFQGRILFACDVVVYVLKESSLLQEHWLWLGEEDVVDASEAMVIGEVAEGKTEDGHYERKELSPAGTLPFLLAEVAPKYDELKFLRGNSGFAVIAIAIQALGYIYAVVFRTVKELSVAPLEVIGLTLNIVLLLEVSVYSVFSPCHRPLVIYMNSERDAKLCSMLPTMNEQYLPIEWLIKMSKIAVGLVVVCLCSIIVYFIVTLLKISNILVVLPLIIFVVATILYAILPSYQRARKFKNWSPSIIDWSIVLLHVVAYAWAIVITIVYWKSQHFSTRVGLLNLSQLIPFIG